MDRKGSYLSEDLATLHLLRTEDNGRIENRGAIQELTRNDAADKRHDCSRTRPQRHSDREHFAATDARVEITARDLTQCCTSKANRVMGQWTDTPQANDLDLQPRIHSQTQYLQFVLSALATEQQLKMSALENVRSSSFAPTRTSSSRAQPMLQDIPSIAGRSGQCVWTTQRKLLV